jgi:hypothetical protein
MWAMSSVAGDLDQAVENGLVGDAFQRVTDQPTEARGRGIRPRGYPPELFNHRARRVRTSPRAPERGDDIAFQRWVGQGR